MIVVFKNFYRFNNFPVKNYNKKINHHLKIKNYGTH